MNKGIKRNIKLGFFVVVGLIIAVWVVYYLGSRQNLFGSTTRIYGIFQTVGGLQAGNNVRFAGINIGTVEEIKLVSDSSVRVTMLINNDASKFIKKSSQASIGGEGLMGNKVVNISSGSSGATIEDGDVIATTNPVDLDQIMSILQKTSQNAETITSNLAAISERVRDGKGTVGRLLTDTVIVQRFDNMVTLIEDAGMNAKSITRDLAALSSKTRNGEGTIGMLMTNDTLANHFVQTMGTLQETSDRALILTSNLTDFSEKLNNKEGTLGRLLTDTAMAENIDKTILQARETAIGINRTSEKLNQSWILNLFSGGRNNKKNKSEENKQVSNQDVSAKKEIK